MSLFVSDRVTRLSERPQDHHKPASRWAFYGGFSNDFYRRTEGSSSNRRLTCYFTKTSTKTSVRATATDVSVSAETITRAPRLFSGAGSPVWCVRPRHRSYTATNWPGRPERHVPTVCSCTPDIWSPRVLGVTRHDDTSNRSKNPVERS